MEAHPVYSAGHMVPPPFCANCFRPATLAWPLDYGGEETTCDRCVPAPASGPARSLAADAPESKLLLSREDAAKWLGVSPDAFDVHVRPRVGARMVGRRPMFAVDALRAYSKAGTKGLS